MGFVRKFSAHTSALVIIIVIAATLAYAWGSTGHKIINRKASMHLPGAMSSYKADSLFYETHASDADIRRNNSDTTFNAEQWRHYIDIDDYPNFHSIPHDRDSLMRLYGYQRVKTNGMNPWVTETFVDSLTSQLQRGDRATARTTMSDLGHYVGDAHQPLHCTENYDGQYTGNNGIHSRYESTMINAYQFSITVHKDSVQYIDSPRDFAFDYIYHSNSLKDSIFAADNYAKAISGWNGAGTPPAAYYPALWSKCQNFTIDQFQRATEDLASLWFTAWVNAGLSTDVQESMEQMPNGFELMQNYPNPFNPKTELRYRISEFGLVRMAVYDLLGNQVAMLVNEVKPPGEYAVSWDAGSAASGIYFCRLSFGKFEGVRKMVVVR
ncbi:MAG TPA: S1/P1 nuclease [Bacteroidota bacterium]|nr:S1/P1 nuclease [Bacteroidota bacterium]